MRQIQEVRIKSPYIQESKIDYKDAIRNLAPNFKHKDGRIYASKPGEPYWVYTVAPYHANFKSQIEDGVWTLVNQLNKKNYMTVSSCEGHYFHDDCIRVSLIFITFKEAKKFIKRCSKIEGWFFKIENKKRSIWKSNSDNNGNVVDSQYKIIQKEEMKGIFDHYNTIFYRNYDEYTFVDMFLAKYPESGIKKFVMKYLLVKPTKEFFKNKKKMEDYITNDLEIYKE